ncbi:50S ribosomal protein L17 [Candidatus Beckwithbacteria bacterium]|nr:50S ribosomal protein L17 [Candidatus Beckwithbacteria bacterium]
MRHQVSGLKLNRDTNHRKQLVKTMVSQLVLQGSMVTTEAKAKLIRNVTQKLLVKAKENTLHIRRQLIAQLGNPQAVKQMMDHIAPKLADAPGGFVTMVRQGTRRGDNTMMIKLELPVVKELIQEQAQKAKEEKKIAKKPVKKTDKAESKKK